MAEPTFTVEAAFTTDPLVADGSVVWEDLSSRLRGFSTGRAVDGQGGSEAGTATIRLENRDGELTPANTTGTWFGQLLPNRRVRVRSTHSAVTRYEFDGFIDRYRQERNGPSDVTCVLECSDGTKVLNLERTPTFDDYPDRVSGQVLEPIWGYWRLNEPPSTRVRPGGYVKRPDNKDKDKKPQKRWRPKKRIRYLTGVSGPEAQVIGNPSFSQSVSDGPVSGEMSYGMSFFGTQRVKIPVPEADDRPGAEHAICVSAVIWPLFEDPAGGTGRIISGPSVSGIGPAWLLQTQTNSQLAAQVLVNAAGVTVSAVSPNDAIPEQTWSHILMAWRGDTGLLQLFVNGELVDSDTLAGTMQRGDTGEPIHIGYEPDQAVAAMEGVIAEVVVSEHKAGEDFDAAVEALYRSSVAGFGSPADLPLSGTRIGEILDGNTAAELAPSFFTSDRRDIAAGETLVLPQRLDESRLELLRRVAETEGGLLFVGKDGKIVFRDNLWLTAGAGATVQGTFSNVLPTSLPYTTDLEPVLSGEDVWPIVTVTREGGEAQTVGDDTGGLGGDALEVNDTLHVSDAAALDRATILQSRVGTARGRVDRITLDGMMSPSLYPHILGRELGDRVQVEHEYPDGTVELTDCRIVGITRNTTGLRHTATWELAPAYAATDGYWHLGVPGSTELGTSTILG